MRYHHDGSSLGMQRGKVNGRMRPNELWVSAAMARIEEVEALLRRANKRIKVYFIIIVSVVQWDLCASIRKIGANSVSVW